MRLNSIDGGLFCLVDGAGTVMFNDERIDVVCDLLGCHRPAVYARMTLNSALLSNGRPSTAWSFVPHGRRVWYKIIARHAGLESRV